MGKGVVMPLLGHSSPGRLHMRLEVWLEMDTAADSVASTQNFMLWRGWEQPGLRSSAAKGTDLFFFSFFSLLFNDQFCSHNLI